MANYKTGPMGMSSGSDDPQTPNYKKLSHVGELPAKQIAHEILPNRHAMSTITGGDPIHRSMNNYSKMTPMDASGKGTMGINIFSIGRNI